MRTIRNDVDYLIHLLYCSLTEATPIDKPGFVDWNNIFNLSTFHHVENMAYYAIEKLQDKPSDELWSKWKKIKNGIVFQDIIQNRELYKLSQTFSDNKIRHIPLKGCILKKLYPQTDMRYMCDLDILIDEQNAHSVYDIMCKLGYECDVLNKDHHDVYTKKPVLHVEIHIDLFSKLKDIFYNYYKDIIDRSTPNKDNPFIYEMSNEEFYAYYLSHTYKHYNKLGGTGIRSLCDVFILEKELMPHIDKQHFYGIIKKLNIDDFYNQLIDTVGYLFYDKPITDNIDKMLKYILSSGAYGTLEQFMDNNIEVHGKLKYFIQKIFMPYSQMKLFYKKIEKYPFLLPYYWIKRLILSLIFKPKAVFYQLKYILKK